MSEERIKVVVDCSEDTPITKQEFRDEVNINNIMDKARRGHAPTFTDRIPQYADVTGVPSFQEANRMIKDAERLFLALPLKLRQRFNNDPGEYLDFMADPERAEEARELGLIPPEEPEPIKSQPEPDEGVQTE